MTAALRLAVATTLMAATIALGHLLGSLLD